jgi:hypothetical protein
MSPHHDEGNLTTPHGPEGPHHGPATPHHGPHH